MNTLHYYLMADHSLFHKALFASIKSTGLTSGQPKVLDYLADNDGAVQKDIAAGCCIEPATLTNLLNGMEKEKLLPLFLSERKEKKRQKQIEKNLRQGQLTHEKAVKRRAEREAAEAKKAAAEKDTNPCQAMTV